MYENENNLNNHADGQTSGGTVDNYTNNTYTGGQGQTGSVYGNQSSGYNVSGSYGQGNYNAGSYNTTYNAQGSTTYGGQTGNYSGQNGNYTMPNSTTYGSYQYGNYQQGGMGNGGNGPKKKGTGKKVAIVIAAVLALSLLVGGAYVSFSKIISNQNLIASNKDEEKAADKIEEKAGGSTEESSDTAQAEESAEASNSSAGISQTETLDNSATVVTDVTEVVSTAMPAMVSINNNYTQSASYFGQTYSENLTASGSGIIVGTNDTELLIATNYHVIEGADSLEVQFVDENKAAAEVKGTDSNMDLAVIAVQLSDLSNDTKNAIAIAKLGDSESLVLGEPAIAIGNALGYGQSVTTGVISAVNRVIDLDNSKQGTFIQTSAAINPGNSGGALLNINGEVIGINSNKIGGEAIEGMGYAIPISTAKPIIEKLMTEKTRSKASDEERGYLGIAGFSVTSEVHEMYGLPLGVYVASVSEDGGAQAAGLQKGDIITALDGSEISSMDDLQNRLAYYRIGEEATLTIVRQASGYQENQTITVTLGAKATTENANTSGAYDGQSQEDNQSEEQQGQSGNGFNMDPFGDGFGGFSFNFGN